MMEDLRATTSYKYKPSLCNHITVLAGMHEPYLFVNP